MKRMNEAELLYQLFKQMEDLHEIMEGLNFKGM